MKRALVLSGGGARGAYQIGVWKALRKLHIDIGIVTGTSVGAINGALFVQKSYHKSKYLWSKLNYNTLFTEKINENNNKEILKMYGKNILLKGGMDTSKLEELLASTLNIEDFYRSPIDYGLITFNLSNLKHQELTKNNIPKEKLKDYIMASATCFPAFKKKQIDGKTYVDGGYYDNLPINLAIDMGAEELIIVDLNAIGIKRQIKDTSLEFIYINPKNKIGSFLDFKRSTMNKSIIFGYNDTMKAFHELDGNLFTFKKEHLKTNYHKRRRLFCKTCHELLKVCSKTTPSFINKGKNSLYRMLETKKEQQEEKQINETLEYLGTIFSLPEEKIYSINTYHYLLKKRLLDTDDLSRQKLESKIKKKEFNQIISRKEIVKFFYRRLLIRGNLKLLTKYMILFPKELIAAIYLTII